jgi:hypothetical protein
MEPDIIPPNKESIEEEEAFERFREQQFATVARRGHKDGQEGRAGRGQAGSPRGQEVTYATLQGRGQGGYSQLVAGRGAGAWGRGACFPREWPEEVTSQTPLVGGRQYVVWEGGGGAKESNV